MKALVTIGLEIKDPIALCEDTCEDNLEAAVKALIEETGLDGLYDDVGVKDVSVRLDKEGKAFDLGAKMCHCGHRHDAHGNPDLQCRDCNCWEFHQDDCTEEHVSEPCDCGHQQNRHNVVKGCLDCGCNVVSFA